MVANMQGLRKSAEDRYSRIALGLGLPSNSSWKEINDRLRKAKYIKAEPSRILATCPCKENKLFGIKIDLIKLPAPKLHQKDGGNYVQTYGMHILQSPDEKWTNWSIARGTIHDKNHLVGLCIPPQHNWQIRELWKKEGKDVTWALALGMPPAAIIAAGMPVPDEMSELDYVNAITGTSLDLVRCETNDLLVPANSEIIMEGTLSITEMGPEGLFGEYFGHSFSKEPQLCPVYEVKAVTYRNDAILPVSVPGKITDESVSCQSTVRGKRRVLTGIAHLPSSRSTYLGRFSPIRDICELGGPRSELQEAQNVGNHTRRALQKSRQCSLQ